MGEIVKLSSENLVELPQQFIEALGHPSHFEISIEGARLILTPTRPVTFDDIAQRFADLQITETDIEEAIAWARQTKQPTSQP